MKEQNNVYEIAGLTSNKFLFGNKRTKSLLLVIENDIYRKQSQTSKSSTTNKPQEVVDR